MEIILLNSHYVDHLYMKDNHILVVNHDDYTCLMVMEGSNYQRNKNKSNTGNNFAAPTSLKNCAVVVPATSFNSKIFVDTFLEVPTRLVRVLLKQGRNFLNLIQGMNNP
jgi:hypothetical protein